MKKVFFLFSLFTIEICCANFIYSLFTLSYADTIRTNDGDELKGIVVEDYKDRVVLSTVEGEKTIMKSDIRELYFDSEEENLVKLAEQARERRDYGRAFGFYNMAYKKNPNSKAAKDGFVFLQGYLFRQEERKKSDDMKKREEFERGISAVMEEKPSKAGKITPEEKLKDLTGLALVSDDGMVRVRGVEKKSPAGDAGIKQADYIIAIWGRLTGYMSLDDVINIILDKPSLEIKCTIQRTIQLDASGASFGMGIDGMRVDNVKNDSPASEGGLKKDDLITAIEGKSTRYTPLAKAVASIKRLKSVRLTINREVLIWRKD